MIGVFSRCSQRDCRHRYLQHRFSPASRAGRSPSGRANSSSPPAQPAGQGADHHRASAQHRRRTSGAHDISSLWASSPRPGTSRTSAHSRVAGSACCSTRIDPHDRGALPRHRPGMAIIGLGLNDRRRHGSSTRSAGGSDEPAADQLNVDGVPSCRCRRRGGQTVAGRQIRLGKSMTAWRLRLPTALLRQHRIRRHQPRRPRTRHAPSATATA